MRAFVATVDLLERSSPEQRHRAGVPFLPSARQGHVVWRQGRIGVAQVRPCLPATQPVCVADARLDNITELCAALDLPLDQEWHEASVIARAFQKWGPDCVQRFVGEYAFILCVGHEAEWFAACDPLGLRSLRWVIEDNCLIVGTRTQAVAACLATPPGPDIPLLREHVMGGDQGWVEATGLKGVRRLPPGYALHVAGASVRLERVDRLGARRVERFATDAQYVARFQELIEQSVRRQLRGAGSVAIALSGGLDSSAVASLTGQLIRNGNVARQVDALSLTFPDSPEADERHFQSTVLRAYPELRAAEIPADDCWYFKAPPGTSVPDEVEANAGGAVVRRLLSTASDRGCRIILSGLYGDQLLGPTLHWSRLADQELRHWPREWWALTGRMGLLRGAHCLARATLAKIRGGQPRTDAVAPLLAHPSLPTHASAGSYEMLVGGGTVLQHRNWEQWAAEAGVEWRFPFLDRDLVEFMLGVPTHLRGQGVWTKRIMRDALKGVLPEDVRQRRHWTTLQPLVSRGIDREGGRLTELVASSRAVANGVTTRAEAERRLAVAVQTRTYAAAVRLQRFVSVETWLRARECNNGGNDDERRNQDGLTGDGCSHAGAEGL